MYAIRSYYVKNDCHDFTIKTVTNQFNGTGKRHAIYTKIFRVLSDMEDSLINRQIFWNSISYYNYIQQRNNFV